MQINIFWHFIFILNAINLRLTNIKGVEKNEKNNLLKILTCSNKINDVYMSTLFHLINIFPPTHPQT